MREAWNFYCKNEANMGFFALCAVQTVLSSTSLCFHAETLSHGMLLNSAWYSKNLEVSKLSPYYHI